MYSSKDFATTKGEITCVVPERLKHGEVEKKGLASGFSDERKHPVFVVDLPSKTMSMTIGHLNEGQSTRQHRHSYETMLYILEGEGRTHINDQVIDWKTGDAVYVPVWAWHSHQNTGTGLCRYLACENAPLLLNLGNLAIREER